MKTFRSLLMLVALLMEVTTGFGQTNSPLIKNVPQLSGWSDYSEVEKTKTNPVTGTTVTIQIKCFYFTLSLEEKTAEVAEFYYYEDEITHSYITEVNIPDTITYKDEKYAVTSIRNNAFSRSIITKISIPNGIISIGRSAFEECTHLTSLFIPESVSFVDMWAFCKCTG